MFIKFLASSIRLSAVFLYGSTGETLVEKSGHLNLGIPGIMSFSAAAACIAEYYLVKAGVNSGFVLVLLGILVAFAVGALLGFLYSFLTVSLKCNQNVVGLAMTTFGVGLAGYNIAAMKEKLYIISRASKFFYKLFDYNKNSSFETLFFSYGTLVYLAIIIAVVVQIVLSKTRGGLSLRAVGENPATADAAGINVTKYRYIATCIGCGISGLGGLFCIMDYMGGSWEYMLEGLGWLSVALVIFTLWKPAFSILGSIVFACLYKAGSYISGITLAQMELFKMLPYVVTIIVLIVTSIFDSKNAQPPQALGQNYFREDR